MYFQGATKNGEPDGTAFSAFTKSFIVDANWIINRNSGTTNTTLQLSWPAALEGSAFQVLLDNEIGISKYDGVSWDPASGTGNQAGDFAARNSLISFGAFGMAKTGVPLALKFKSIKVYQLNKDLQVDWTILNEADIDHYEIERSSDGREFSTVGTVAALGNTVSEINYSWIDITATGQTYFYRIKAVDREGKFSYSSIIRIDLNRTGSGISIYPNPVTSGHISFQSGDLQKGNYTVIVYNSNGQRVYSQQLTHPGGAITQLIELPLSIQTGMYFLQLEKDGLKVISKPFIVQ